MKNLTLINTTWKQRIPPVITAEERTLRSAETTDENREAKRTLNESIQARSLIDVSAEEAAQAQALYDAHMPEGAGLIAADITLPNGTGIINCRVNGEHTQVRF
jgi:hypothetical protein